MKTHEMNQTDTDTNKNNDKNTPEYKEILINATEDESRVAVVVNGTIQELSVQHSSRMNLKGNIYKGKIVQIQDSLQAAFVEYGNKKHGFLALDEISFDIFPPLDSRGDKKGIRSRIKQGMEVLVQVIREPTETKGAALSTFIHLPGIYLVFVPNSTDGGVSKKILDDAERDRLKAFISGINSEKNTVIIRTAGVGIDLNELKKDYQRIKREWEVIYEKYLNMPKPGLVHAEAGNTTKTIRDYFNDSVATIWIDNPTTFQEVHSFFRQEMPSFLNRLKLYLGEKSMFSDFGIEEQIEDLAEKKVHLRSGGSIIIDQTEALVAIDVNSGKSRQESNSDQTAVRTNLEAAEEITRQLRLRNLAGLIVIDFIDMRSAADCKKVEDLLHDKMQTDKASHNIGSISQFGLLEMSRQRLAQGFATTLEDKCIHCRGTGRIPNIVTSANRVLRKLRNRASERDCEGIAVTVPFEVGSYLLNKKRGEIFTLEREFDIGITIKGSLDMHDFEDTSLTTVKRKDVEVAQASKSPTAERHIEEPKSGKSRSEIEEPRSGKSRSEKTSTQEEDRPRRAKKETAKPQEEEAENRPARAAKKTGTAKSGRGNKTAPAGDENIFPGCLFQDHEEFSSETKAELIVNLRNRILGKMSADSIFIHPDFLFPEDAVAPRAKSAPKVAAKTEKQSGRDSEDNEPGDVDGNKAVADEGKTTDTKKNPSGNRSKPAAKQSDKEQEDTKTVAKSGNSRSRGSRSSGASTAKNTGSASTSGGSSRNRTPASAKSGSAEVADKKQPAKTAPAKAAPARNTAAAKPRTGNTKEVAASPASSKQGNSGRNRPASSRAKPATASTANKTGKAEPKASTGTKKANSPRSTGKK